MKIKEGISVLTILALTIFSFSSCAPFEPSSALSSPNAEDSEGDSMEDLICVGFSQLGSESSWRLANTKSVENTLTEENGFFLLSDNARQQQEKQIKAIRSFISQRVDVIVFSPVMEDGWETILKEAKEADIPVILLDRMIDVEDEDLYTTFVGEDMEKEGIKAGEWLEQDLEGDRENEEEINIAVLDGTSGSSAQIGRARGFTEVASRNRNWHIVAEDDANFTTAKAKEVMERFLKEYKDIDVVVSQNDDMTIGALEAIEEAGLTTGPEGDIRVISFDATSDGLQLVKDGRIDVDVECNPLSGPLLASVIQDIADGKKVKKEYFMQENVFTIDNVDAYIDSREY